MGNHDALEKVLLPYIDTPILGARKGQRLDLLILMSECDADHGLWLTSAERSACGVHLTLLYSPKSDVLIAARHQHFSVGMCRHRKYLVRAALLNGDFLVCLPLQGEDRVFMIVHGTEDKGGILRETEGTRRLLWYC